MPLDVMCRWDGQAFWPASQLEKVQLLPKGVMYRVQVSQPRSQKHHRRTMGIIHVAYNNWPENHEFKPHDEKEFRAWLQCKAGYCGRRIFEFGDDMTPNAITGTAQAAVIEAKSHDYAFPRSHEARLALYWPKSINFATLDQREFAPIAQAIEDVICAELSVTSAFLERQHKAIEESDDRVIAALKQTFPDAEITETEI